MSFQARLASCVSSSRRRSLISSATAESPERVGLLGRRRLGERYFAFDRDRLRRGRLADSRRAARRRGHRPRLPASSAASPRVAEQAVVVVDGCDDLDAFRQLAARQHHGIRTELAADRGQRRTHVSGHESSDVHLSFLRKLRSIRAGQQTRARCHRSGYRRSRPRAAICCAAPRRTRAPRDSARRGA